ncbi:hypothetical protein ACQ4PT_012610 [Festuca glaucescens]
MANPSGACLKNSSLGAAEEPEPGAATATLMEAEEYRQMMEIMDEVNFSLYGMRLPRTAASSMLKGPLAVLTKAKQRNLVMPDMKGQGSGQDSFEGATVLEARAGYHENPIASLDFASLYPSNMMAHNLCYLNGLQGYGDQLCHDDDLSLSANQELTAQIYSHTKRGSGFLKEFLKEFTEFLHKCSLTES